MSYFYISNPYNGSEEQKELRAQIAAKTCALLVRKGIHAWSPIVHNHAMMKTFKDFTLEERQTKILEFDFSLLKRAHGMIVLTIEGWKESFGVTKEIAYCREHSLPIYLLDPQELTEDFTLEHLMARSLT
jgi:hypothetical protein